MQGTHTFIVFFVGLTTALAAFLFFVQ